MRSSIVLFAVMLVSAFAMPAGDLEFEPAVFEVVRDSTGFVQTLVKFRSISGDSVKVTNLAGSCKCAMGTVQRPMAYDTLAGTIYLGINAKHFTDSVNYVDYTISHTGPASPSHYRVIVRVEP